MAKSKLTNANIKRAAQTALQRTDIRESVRDLTLRALKGRNLDVARINDVIRAMTEGISAGVSKHTGDMNQALSQAFSGLDEALMKSAEASHLALLELTSRAGEVHRDEVKHAIHGLSRLEDEFLSTVSKASGGAGQKVKAGWRDLIMHARRTGTDTGTKVAGIVREFSGSMGSIALDSTKTGLASARAVGARFTELASGILSGIADALRKGPEPFRVAGIGKTMTRARKRRQVKR